MAGAFLEGVQEGYQLQTLAHTAPIDKEATILKSKLALDQLKNYERAMAEMGQQHATQQAGGQPADAMNTTKRFAEILMNSGNYEQGMELMEKVVKVQKDGADIQSKQLDDTIKQHDQMAREFNPDTIKSDEDWKAAWQRYAMIHADEINTPEKQAFVQKMMQTPYDPQMVQQLYAGTVTALQKAQTELAKIKASREQAGIQLDKLKTQYAGQRAAAEKERADAYGKYVGKKVENMQANKPKKLTSSDIGMVVDELKPEYADADKAEIRKRSIPIAERTLELMQEENMSRSEAMKQAISEAKDRGDLGGLTTQKKALGSTPEKPLPLDGNAINAPGFKFKPNKYYAIGGKIILATGEDTYDEVDAGDDEEDQ